MTLLSRASEILKANVHHLLDGAEDPEVMLEHLVRETDAAVLELRRETVHAVARARQLERKRTAAAARAEDLEAKAAVALEKDDEGLARRLLAQRVDAQRDVESYGAEHAEADRLAAKLKNELAAMEDQAGQARRKKDELIRRKKAAAARMRTQQAARRTADAVRAVSGGVDEGRFGGYADEIGELEARAEADLELSGTADADDRRLAELERESRVDEDLERLRRRRNDG